MSDKTIRIRTTPLGGDKYVKLNINQEFDFVEILSLKISQEQAYKNFCSDYGVVVGRVIVNSGFGVPNARVSIFIPIDDVDKENPQIKGLYPFEVLSDKDSNGIRYNLLPKSTESENDCFTPVGTFPSKREILDDEDILYIYQKYYKFTTTTNDAGDFMIFGVPLGNYKLHVDLDISDMGYASQRPYDSIEQGSSLALFDSPTKFKSGTNLDRLAQIKTANTSVNVQPFWGDVDECQVGISRVDVDMNYNITPNAIFMGSIFGDQDKYNVNSNCMPDKGSGDLCNQMASEGTIEMIRKTVFGEIEKLDVKGGRVIDENGSWAYQIPMNLDYVVTDEYGYLIPSQDPTKGIPTKASIRFKIGMDDNMGGLGRGRSRAKFLVPHNPTKADEVDYEFGPLTKDSSFKELYWNKIYSVKGFIPRYQRAREAPGIFSTATNRKMVSIKNCDGCIGDKNPVPFNRVSTKSNAIFFIICLMMYILSVQFAFVNATIVFFFNTIAKIFNSFIEALASICVSFRIFGRGINVCPLGGLRRFKLPIIPCLNAKCPKDEAVPYTFAPWCFNNNPGRDLLSGEVFTDIQNLPNCIAVEMAKDMDLFKYDFYNDWLNGSLYSFLIRFKKYRNSEAYCDYDCDKYGTCKSTLLMDACFSSDIDGRKVQITEGIVKKVGEEYYYAASTRNGMYKLLATDIIHLGSVFNCDWQGVPKIQQFLKASTFNGYPIIDEYDPDEPGNRRLSGQVDIGPNFDGLFFDIGCEGLYSDATQCLNVKHANELGVDLDQKEYDQFGNIQQTPDYVISEDEINPIYGVYVRDMLYRLNNNPNQLYLTQPATINTKFNIRNIGGYSLTSPTDNGQQYVDYRGLVADYGFQQPKNSYFFYFGLLPGKSGLELMNNKFFTSCLFDIKKEFLIKILNFTGVTASCQTNQLTNGSVSFSIISGNGPFTITTSGPNYTNVTTVSGATPTINLSNLVAGTYTIQAVDVNQTVVIQTFDIPSPPTLSAQAAAINITGATSNGQIILQEIIGGCQPYNATLYNHAGATISGPVQITTLPYTFNNLPQDSLSNGLTGASEHFGYYIILTDSSNPAQTYTIWDLPISGPTSLIVVPGNILDVNCYGDATGKMVINVSGGTSPYIISGNRIPQLPLVEESQQNFTGPSGQFLLAGTYQITVTDAASPQQTQISTIILKNLHPELEIEFANINELPKQCDSTKYVIRFRIIGTGADGPGTGFGNTYLNLVNTSPAYQGKVWYRYAKDEGILPLSAPNAVWSQPISTTLIPNTTNEFYATIPSSVIFDNIAIALATPDGQCISDYMEQNTQLVIDQISLAPVLQITNPIYTEQCTVGAVNIKFSISHFNLGINHRAPYTLFYKVRETGSSWPANFTEYSITTSTFPITTTPVPITQNQQQGINIPVGTIINPVQYCDIEYYLVDNVGCESSHVTRNNIELPLDALTITKYPNGNGTIRYVASGGIGTYKTISGPLVENDLTGLGGSIGCASVADVVIVRDRGGNGCEVSRSFIRNC